MERRDLREIIFLIEIWCLLSQSPIQSDIFQHQSSLSHTKQRTDN